MKGKCKRILSTILTLVMVLALLPVSALAHPGGTPSDRTITITLEAASGFDITGIAGQQVTVTSGEKTYNATVPSSGPYQIQVTGQFGNDVTVTWGDYYGSANISYGTSTVTIYLQCPQFGWRMGVITKSGSGYVAANNSTQNSYSSKVKVKINGAENNITYLTGRGNNPDASASGIVITPDDGYYVKAVLVCCNDSGTGYGCTTAQGSDIYASINTDMSTGAYEFTPVFHKGAGYPSWIIIELGVAPSPVYAQYDFNLTGATGLSVDIPSDDKFNDTTAVYTYTQGTDSVPVHSVLALKDGTTTVNVNDVVVVGEKAYKFQGWKAQYYLTASVSGSTVTLSEAHGTAQDVAVGANVTLNRHVKFVAQWEETTMPTGTLTVTKTVSGLDNGVSLPNNFAITVKQGDTVVATKGLTDATGSGTDASPYSWTINNLTPGTYTVEESNYAVAGYSVTATPVYDPDSSVDGDEVPGKTTATVTAGGTATAALTNTYTKQYTLTVKYYYDSVDASNEFTPVGVTTFSYTLNKGASWNIIVGTPGAGETCTHNAPESVTRTVNGSEVNYVFDSVASDALEGTITGDVTVNLVYSKDEIGEGEDLNQPDGIPDKYQVTVKYISSDENMGAVTGTTEVLTIKDTSGKYLTTGTVKISGSVASATSGYAFTEWTAKSSDATEMVSFAVDENDAKILTSEQEISVTGGRVYTFTANFEGYPVVSVDKTLKTTVPENGFKIGNVVEWEIKVSNSGTEKATGLSLSDTLTIGSRTVSLTPTAEGLNASNFEVAAKSEVTFIAQYTVIKDDLGETLNNKAVVTVTEGNKPEDSDNTGKVENPYSKLGVTKTRTTAAEVQVGDTIEWTITISNSGNTDANKVTIADTLNNGANAVITLDGNTVTEVNVPAGGTVTLEASYLVVEADAGKTLTNAVTVSNPADPDDKASDTDEGTKVAARYTVTTSIDKHGEITPTTTYNAGEDAEVYFTVDQNYAIKSVTVDGIETKDYSWDRTKSAYVITFPSIDNDHNVVVTTTYNGYIPPVVNDPTIKVKGLNTVDHVAYIIGVGNDEVNPLGTITRAEIANIYFRLMTDEFRSANWGTDNRFKDVPDDAWYTMAVLTLDKAGIITDSDDGNFRPNDPITRAELAVMAAQFCTVTGKIPATSFKDVPSTHWAAKEIALIEYAGWIEGYAGYFRPDDNLTRAEAVTIVNRMLQRGAEEENMLPDMVTFVDNADPDMWYYEAIQEAANAHDYTRTTKLLTGETFRGEKWTALLEATDWAALEQAWIAANSK